ncbi:MAG: GntR family transcriptional regulator [Oscillospiraceae bacterium]|nr:GntR family transcriptional regulator [Oscillospiraceae bacterium]
MIKQYTTLADRVFDRLERDIISGVYKKGEILTELRLVEELGVSRTPIREALRRLGQERLIREGPKGSVVVGITKRDLEDILLMRVRIEGLVAYFAAQNRTQEQLDEMLHTLELQEYYVSRGDTAHVVEMDVRFHDLIYTMADHQMLTDALEPMLRKIMKFRRESMDILSRAERSASEHRKLYETIAAGERDRAEALMTYHVENARQSILDACPE